MHLNNVFFYHIQLHSGAQVANCESRTVHKRIISNDDIKESDMPFDTGVIRHNLNLVPTICTEKPFQMDTKHASTFHSKWIMVDYIFFSESNQPQLGSLRLLENYQLPTISECWNTGPIPNDRLGSDHYSIASRFSIE